MLDHECNKFVMIYCLLNLTVVMVEFDPTLYTVSEGGAVNFTIHRLTPAMRTASVIFNTIPDSATGVHTTLLIIS